MRVVEGTYNFPLGKHASRLRPPARLSHPCLDAKQIAPLGLGRKVPEVVKIALQVAFTPNWT